MRCKYCKYKQEYVGEGSGYYEEDSCTLCFLTSDEEQTEDRNGDIGCLFNQRTLDKRKRQLDKLFKGE